MKLTVRTLADLGEDVVLAPERWIATALDDEDNESSVPLSDLVIERRERASEDNVLIFDTTHAKDGMLDVFGALRSPPSTKSSKKTAHAGDLVISRLRPYLRQVAFVHPRAVDIGALDNKGLALSTEFYVLSSINKKESIAYLLPFLLSAKTQAILAAAQEGGHHPRVPRSVLLAMRVPKSIVDDRAKTNKEITTKLEALYTATNAYQAMLAR
jgi:hypothetical protein